MTCNILEAQSYTNLSSKIGLNHVRSLFLHCFGGEVIFVHNMHDFIFEFRVAKTPKVHIETNSLFQRRSCISNTTVIHLLFWKQLEKKQQKSIIHVHSVVGQRKKKKYQHLGGCLKSRISYLLGFQVLVDISHYIPIYTL